MDTEKIKFQAGKVSVITPVYNGEFHLGKMLDSVLAQTYSDIEMILADDGSTDGTLKLAESYREKFAARGYGFRILQGAHRNASAAINRGLPYVTGEYLIWPDSDDILTPESVEKRVDFLRKHPEYDCVRSLSYYFKADTGEMCNEADEQQGDLTKEELFWDILEAKTFVCCGCYMLKSEEFFAIYPERRIPEFDVGQNFQMLLPFMYRHKCPTLTETLYGVAVRAGSHSRTELTQEEEEKKFNDYEALADEIVKICGIEDEASLKLIDCWKARRRYKIALKYGRKKEARRALRLLRSCGEISFQEAMKEIIWARFVRGWIKETIYPLYRKIISSKPCA